MAKTKDEIQELLLTGLFRKGIADKYISIINDGTYIEYNCNNKPSPRRLSNPEELVQAETFLKLIYDYGYKPEYIKQFVSITMGSEVKFADIVVYNDKECLQPHILVECKKQDVSEAEFQQAIEQAYSYAYALPSDMKFLWVTSGIKNEYYEVDKKQSTRIQLSDIPQFGAKSVASYKYVYRADDISSGDGTQKYFDIKAIQQSELTRRFKLAHSALWAGGQLNPSEAFDELDKLVFCKIWDERKPRTKGKPYDFQIITIDRTEERDEQKRRHKENELLKERICALYEEGRKKDKEVFRDNIRLSPEKIRTVVSYLESVNLSETDLDSKGRAFETFIGSLFRGNFGQYFTPRPIVEFVVEVLPITHDSRVLDTSCGSGGFLLYTLNKIRNKATAIYTDYLNDTRQYKHWYVYWHDFAATNLYGIEISEQISRTAKMNMIIHDDGHTNVITSDGLIDESEIALRTENHNFKYGSFDFIVTNPPFGSTIRLVEHSYLKKYALGKKQPDWLSIKDVEKLRDSQSSEVLFIEQGYKFLREGGMMAIVIPDGVLTNSSLQYVRDQIEDWFRIVAVISLPQTAFAANGAGVKSSVLFLKKWTAAESDKFVQTKQTIKNKLLKEYNYRETVLTWEQEKKEKLKSLQGFNNTTGLTKLSDIKKTTEYKEWSAEISSEYEELLNALKDELNERYKKDKRDWLPDYPIFMAIAENIGYDATGKDTDVNELEMIGEELKKFIETI